MSGGYFDYKEFYINDIADKIEELIANNDRTDKNEYGEEVGFHFPPDVIEKFKEALVTLRKAGLMVHRIDWLVSCDDNIDIFRKQWKKDIDEFKI